MRKFVFINNHNSRLDLDTPNRFVNNPTNLGFSTQVDVQYTINGYRAINQGLVNPNIEFELILGGSGLNPYSEYTKVINFLTDSEELVLEYTTDSGRYYCDVTVHGIDKSEITEYDILRCKMSLTPLSPWYTETIVNLSGKHVTPGTGKLTSGVYPYSYAVNTIVKSLPEGNINIEKLSPLFGGFIGCVLKLKAHTDNVNRPAIMNTTADGQLQFDAYDVVLNKGDTLVTSSIESANYCYIRRNDGSVENIIDKQLISSTGFIRLKRGDNFVSINNMFRDYLELELTYREVYISV